MIALPKLFGGKPTSAKSAPRGLASTSLDEATDSTGFPFGAIIDRSHHQATIAIQADGDEVVSESAWRKFETDVVHMDGLVCTVSVDESCRGRQRSRAGVTIHALGKAQRKDSTELMTALATRAATLHTAAAASGIPATLMSARQLEKTTAQAWTPGTEDEGSWPRLSDVAAEESPSRLKVGSRRAITWEIDLADSETGEEVAAALNAITFGPEIVRWARVFRPELIADSENNASTGRGRRSGILTVAVDGSDDDHLEEIAAEVMFVLSARTRLRVRRAVGRQQIMTAAGLGVGVLGWQHIEVTKK
ncbi:hypothetical protein [Ancrocorticia populi]|uniref:hypothetical protein n=1 Tax=Ancrocorticia populi TaxID=2175228 RepID=UPI003F9B6ABF